jgi:acetyl-CoA carboxylase beta subunit
MKATKKCPVCEKLVYTRKLREHLFFCRRANLSK